VGDFTAEWLALREPADHAARSQRLAAAAARVLGSREVRIVDLGSGTGSNLRYLAPRLAAPQHWLLLDRDPALLARVDMAGVERADVSVCTRQVDVSRIDEASTASLFERASLVTASALLDLVSEGWIQKVAESCARAGAVVLFALTYDGTIECAPADRDDQFVRGLVNEHQHRDKGFGAALGPSAVEVTGRAFSSRGYRIERDRSDWVLDAAARALQGELIDGWARAAAETAPARADDVERWRARRRAHVAAGRSEIVVGHEDLAAWIKSPA
jgi:SAM-dependent methyltransferase